MPPSAAPWRPDNRSFRLPEIGVHAVYAQRSHVPPKVRAFVDFLAKRFGPRPAWEKIQPEP